MTHFSQDALSDLCFTFGARDTSFFFYSPIHRSYSTRWQLAIDPGRRLLQFDSVAAFNSVALGGQSIFVAYEDSSGKDQCVLMPPLYFPLDSNQGCTKQDFHRAVHAIIQLRQWIISPDDHPYSTIRIVFGPCRDRLIGNREPNKWGGCYFAKCPRRGTLWNDLPPTCQQAIDARRQTGDATDPHIMAFGLASTFVIVWSDLTYTAELGQWYPTLSTFLLLHSTAVMVDIVLAPCHPDLFYVRVYDQGAATYHSYLRAPIARHDLLQLNVALQSIAYLSGMEKHTMQVVVTHGERKPGSRVLALPQSGELDLHDVVFLEDQLEKNREKDQKIDDGLRLASQVLSMAGNVAGACQIM